LFRLLVALLGARGLLLCAKHLFVAARTVVGRQELQASGGLRARQGEAGGGGRRSAPAAR
jgi:hypothetical protein